MVEMSLKTITTVLFTIMLVMTGIISVSDSSAETTDDTFGDFLVDYGNGSTRWIETNISSTISSTVIHSLNDAGINITISGGVITIDGLTSRDTGGSNTGGTISTPGRTGTTVNCHWNIYYWSNNQLKWMVVDPSEYDSTYSMSKLAVGFYPDGMGPTVDPIYKTAWTMFGGDSENSVHAVL